MMKEVLIKVMVIILQVLVFDLFFLKSSFMFFNV